jgi:aminopeptidase N
LYACVWTKQKEEEFVFSDISERPVPSILRGYSAPVRLESDLTDSDLFFLLAHDSDEFNRLVFPNAATLLYLVIEQLMNIHLLDDFCVLVGRLDKCWHAS